MLIKMDLDKVESKAVLGLFFFSTKNLRRRDGALVQGKESLRAQRVLTNVLTFTSPQGDM